MSQGQPTPGDGRVRPSREMRQRAEQMAELLDRAAPAARARGRRRAAGLSTAFLGLSVVTVGGVGVVLGLDPQSAEQALALPSLDDMPGTDDVAGPARGAAGSGAGPTDAATGVSTLTGDQGLTPRPAAQPDALPPALPPERAPAASRPGAPATPGTGGSTSVRSAPGGARGTGGTGSPTTSRTPGATTTATTPPASASPTSKPKRPTPSPRATTRVSAPSPTVPGPSRRSPATDGRTPSVRGDDATSRHGAAPRGGTPRSTTVIPPG